MLPKNRVRLIVVTVSLALMGLIVMQVFWVTESVAYRRRQFETSAAKALEETSYLLERAEVTKGVLSDPMIVAMMTSDTLSSVRLPGTYREEFRVRDSIVNRNGQEVAIRIVEGSTSDTTAGLFTEARVIREERDTLLVENLREGGRSNVLDTFAFRSMPGLQEMANRIRLVNDLLNRIFIKEQPPVLTQRIDPEMLDSILHARLQANGIDATYSFAVKLANGSPVVGWDHERYDGDTGDAHYTTALFANDPQHNEQAQGMLYVSFQDEDLYILGKMWGILAVSVLLTLAMVSAFGLTLSALFRQKRLSRMKNDFINNMTHELKTPISTISLACEVLGDESISSGESARRRYVGMIREENDRLGNLVEKVLQSAVLEKGEVQLKSETVDIHVLIHEASGAFQLQSNKRNGQLSLVLNAQQHLVKGDKLHLMNVLQNLLDNAFKYVHGEPKVSVLTRNEGGWLVIDVSDNGIGIAREHQRRIFDRLYRVPAGDIHNVKGFGLGLSYVQAILEMHGATITVVSEIGAGSTFTINIPVEHAND